MQALLFACVCALLWIRFISAFISQLDACLPMLFLIFSVDVAGILDCFCAFKGMHMRVIRVRSPSCTVPSFVILSRVLATVASLLS
jgi:hypothetical protein